MGHKHSHFQRSDASYTEKVLPDQDPINAQTLRALKAAKERKDTQEVTFEKLLLRFSTLEDGFDQCHAVFTAPDAPRECKFSADKRLPLLEARKARRKLGIQLSPEEGRELFQYKEGQEDQVMVLFIDFVVACCIIIMHKGIQTVLNEGGDEAVVKMALLAMDAFNYLDRDSNGYLRKEDLTCKMRDVDAPAHAPKKVDPVQKEDAISERWRFMDYNHDGRASFRDFVASLHGWVMGDKSK